MNPPPECNNSACKTINSDRLMSPQNFTSPTLIQPANYTYEQLITMAIGNCDAHMLPACDIIDWISRNFTYYRKDVQEWQDQEREILRENFFEFDLLAEDPTLRNLWAVPPTLEELSRLYAEAVVKNATIATEPIIEGALPTEAKKGK